MDRSGPSIFGSEPFEFVVNGQSIYIHQGLIKNLSRPLERLMSNGMSESQEGRAVLPDETEGTFTRFTHWAYAGFYNAGEFSKRSGMETQEEVDEMIDESPPPIWDPAPLPRRNKKPSSYGDSSSLPKKKEALKEAFLKLQFCEADDERTILMARANTNASEEYTDVFLSHARLYTFAEEWDIQPLKRLALKNLHQTLSAFTLWPECVVDVVVLLRFAYDHTSRPEIGQEPMRNMLCQYITYEMDMMVETAPFRDFLEENRDFLDDFCSHMKGRI